MLARNSTYFKNTVGHRPFQNLTLAYLARTVEKPTASRISRDSSLVSTVPSPATHALFLVPTPMWKLDYVGVNAAELTSHTNKWDLSLPQ